MYRIWRLKQIITPQFCQRRSLLFLFTTPLGYFKMGKTRELSEFERGQIIGLWKGGRTHEAISHVLKIPKSTITDTIARYKNFNTGLTHFRMTMLQFIPQEMLKIGLYRKRLRFFRIGLPNPRILILLNICGMNLNEDFENDLHIQRIFVNLKKHCKMSGKESHPKLTLI